MKSNDLAHLSSLPVAPTGSKPVPKSQFCHVENYWGLCGINAAPHLTAHFAIQRDRSVRVSLAHPPYTQGVQRTPGRAPRVPSGTRFYCVVYRRGYSSCIDSTATAKSSHEKLRAIFAPGVTGLSLPPNSGLFARSYGLRKQQRTSRQLARSTSAQPSDGLPTNSSHPCRSRSQSFKRYSNECEFRPAGFVALIRSGECGPFVRLD